MVTSVFASVRHGSIRNIAPGGVQYCTRESVGWERVWNGLKALMRPPLWPCPLEDALAQRADPARICLNGVTRPWGYRYFLRQLRARRWHPRGL